MVHVAKYTYMDPMGLTFVEMIATFSVDILAIVNTRGPNPS